MPPKTDAQPTPLPSAEKLRRAPAVLIFGGTFDPPHVAHTSLPFDARARFEAARGIEACGDDGAWLVYVPAARSPFKDGLPGASDEDRLEMLRVGLGGRERVAVWTDELDRSPDDVAAEPSYTLDTLRRARALLGDGPELRLLIGADHAAGFSRWRRPREIIELAEPVVMLRTPTDTVDRVIDAVRGSGFWSDDEVERWRGWIVETPVKAVSATQVREHLATLGGTNGRLADGDLAEELDPAVAAWIAERGLYATR